MLDDIVIVTLKKVEPLQLPLASREGRRTHRTTDPVFEEGKKGGTVPTAWNAHGTGLKFWPNIAGWWCSVSECEVFRRNSFRVVGGEFFAHRKFT